MIRKIVLDGGMNQRNSCSGRRVDAPPPPAHRIAKATAMELEQLSYETLLATDWLDRGEDCNGAGRPGRCAAVAKRWGADCVLRICVRASALPGEGTVSGMVGRRGSPSYGMSEAILESVAEGTELKREPTLFCGRYILLRKSPCNGMILVLGLPFRQKESLSEAEVRMYAGQIARGLDSWARG